MTTAYFFSMPYHGHVNPCLPLIQELTRRGERVVLYGLETFRRVAEDAGAIFRPFEYEETEKNIALTTMAAWQMQLVERTLDRLIADAQVDKPAYLLVDYTCLWGRFLAQHLRIPSVVIHTTYPLTWSEARLTFRGIRDLFRAPNVCRRLVTFLLADQRISRRWDIPRVGLPFKLLRANYGELHLVLTGMELAHGVEKLDDRYVFVGPIARGEGVTAGEPLPKLDSRPLLYVSLGTFWRHSSQIYRACIDAFGDSDIQVLITGKDRIAPEVIASLPANIHVCAHVDQIDVLSRCAVFITHGGMNSVCEALLAEVPMLVYPQGFDQFGQALFVERSGTGLVLKPRAITSSKLRELVGRLLQEPDFRARCQQMNRKLRAAGGATRAADLIMAIRDQRPEAQPSEYTRPAVASP
ncbi:MAG: macrolide family glycosyltransferase [Gammaproteobacteria bacterium]